MKQFIACKNDDSVRISRFVQSVTNNMPTSLIHKAFRNKRVKINKMAVKEDYRIVLGDVIELYINDEFFESKPDEPIVKSAKAYPMPEIIFEDNNLLIVNKPCGLLCHSDNTNDTSLIEILINYLVNTGDYSPVNENRFTPSLCNRIDRGTSGLVICAKNYSALRDANAIIQNDLVKKQYLCITGGSPKNGIYTAFHKRDLNVKKVYISANMKTDYKPIKTGVTVIETKNDISLCKIDLYTGKTHQIRAHLAFLNCPILGDKKYGNENLNKKYSQTNQALCAYRLIFAEIPKENTLAYLSGKKITLTNSITKQLFKKL